jgi:hypothetical protein
MTARARYPVKSILRTYPNLLSEVRRQAPTRQAVDPILDTHRALPAWCGFCDQFATAAGGRVA